jgi:phage terminase small subunit
MGTRGPAPTPTSILNLRGSRRGARRLKGEVVGTDGTPLMLPCITENIESKRIFDLVVSQITKLGVMKEQDGISVSMLANELALGEHAAHMAVKSGGDVIEGKGGIPMMNPWARARRESRDAAWRIITHFGLTASSRVALQGQKASGDSKEDTIKNLFKFGS